MAFDAAKERERNMEDRLIENLEQLRDLASTDCTMVDFFISLAGGLARSSVGVIYHEDGYQTDADEEDDVFSHEGLIDPDGVVCHWEIFHDICGEYAYYTDDESLRANTNIVEAIELGGFYLYSYEVQDAS